jgi:hypothetical protein
VKLFVLSGQCRSVVSPYLNPSPVRKPGTRADRIPVRNKYGSPGAAGLVVTDSVPAVTSSPPVGDFSESEVLNGRRDSASSFESSLPSYVK